MTATDFPLLLAQTRSRLDKLTRPTFEREVVEALLTEIRAAYDRDAALVNLMLDPAFAGALNARQEAWRLFVQTAVGLGIPVPATSASLAYYDAYRSARLPANLTQGQRDFFGAHTFRRTDRDGVFHANWTDKRGRVPFSRGTRQKKAPDPFYL